LIALVDYIISKTPTDRSDKILAYSSFHRESVKWWKKPSFFVTSICECTFFGNKVSLKNTQLQDFCVKVANTFVCNFGKEIVEQPRAVSVERLTD
jgi:hypothetical protein